MIGTEIASYRILEKLGQGGMGVVYKAVDTGLDRMVAMKVLNPDLSKNPELVERFRAEARAQANLNHTNLATLYAFMVHQGTAIMVMEFVEGETFAQIIRRRGPIPEVEAIPLFRQALLGIGYAHRAGILHRDIKPSNLMLNKNGLVKVMDFGIAKVIGARGMTRTGTQLGTLAYMSPEQIQNRNVDIRSDVYELGITLYEMLTGHLPFESDSEFQIMQDHVYTPPPPPSKYYPYINKGVENVILKSIEKNSDARFQTVEQFGAALEHPDSLAYTPSVAPADAPTMSLGGGSTLSHPHLSVSAVPPVAPSACSYTRAVFCGFWCCGFSRHSCSPPHRGPHCSKQSGDRRHARSSAHHSSILCANVGSSANANANRSTKIKKAADDRSSCRSRSFSSSALQPTKS